MEMEFLKTIRSQCRLFGFVLSPLVVLACGEVRFEESPALRAGFLFEKEGCSEDRFTQPKSSFGQKVDLLIVSDTSGSLDTERRAVATGIEQFINGLPQGSDYQVGVMLAHLRPAADGNDWVGRLFQAGSEPKILPSSTMTSAQIREHLVTKLTNIQLDAYGTGGGESGIFSLTTALTTRYGENKQEGFFRSDAALAVIFISDENDICVPESNAPQGELDMYTAHCLPTHTPLHLYRSLINHAGNNSLVLGGVLHQTQAEITQASDGVGLGYLDLIQMNSGVMTPISDLTGIPAGLAEIGNLMAARLNLITERRLYKFKEDNQIQVRVNNVLAPLSAFEINPSVPSIRLIDPAATGSSNSVISILNCESWVEL